MREFLIAPDQIAKKKNGGATSAAVRSRSARNELVDAQPRSKRSRFITLLHALTKSCTNFACPSDEAYTSPRHAVRHSIRTPCRRGGGPLERTGLAVAAFVDAVGRGRLAPLSGHVEQVDEVVVASTSGTRGEHAVLRLTGVGVQGAHAANQDGHFRHGQRQRVRAVYQRHRR